MKRIALAFALTFICLTGYGQDVSRISVSFSNDSLTSLISKIERETSVRFYFQREWIDSVRVTVSMNSAAIEDILQQALQGTGMGFFIHHNRVILTPGSSIIPTIDHSFFDPSRSASDRAVARFLRETPTQKEEGDKNIVKEIGKYGSSTQTSARLSGYLRDKESGEPLPGVLVRGATSSSAVTTDQFGFYSIVVPKGMQTLTVELIGMKAIRQKVNVLGDGKLDLLMEPSVTQLKEVVVESDGDVNVSQVQMGVSKIDLKTMKNIPKVLGENDVLKVATTLPGVTTVGEGSSGINVRGGHADQNLVILNEATIYNTSHFLGFFSIFNPDAIRSFELYKSGIPAQHGGRISSTFELLMRDGNQKKFSGQGGVGPITSHLTLEVPIVKDKASVMVGGRSTYSNWILKLLPESVIKNTRAAFSDAFARATYSPDDRNTIYLSMYGSYDNFNLSSDTLFSYSNKLASLQWRHVFNPNMDGLLTVTHSTYDYDIKYESDPFEGFKMGFAVRESNAKLELNNTVGKHKLTYGLQSKLYHLDPGFVNKVSDSSAISNRMVQSEKALESALFLADQFEINEGLSLYVGLRYSMFSALGPRTVYQYVPGLTKSPTSITDTIQYSSGEGIKKYHGPEYRVSLRYKVSGESSIKASYNRTRQYIHMLTNTVSVSPTDTWKLSDQHVLPQIGDQISVGFYRNLKNDAVELSTEVYYKWLQNALDYKTGATLLVNENIDQQVLQGSGKAYGVEVLLRKKSGKLTGWLGYSYSRTFLRLNSEIPGERINRGDYYPANYDKPHDVKLVTNYKLTRRYSFSFNFMYNTGRPITYPIAAYRFGNAYRVAYSDRNAFRIPDYIRADIGFNIEGNHKIKKLAHSYWSISIYNVLGRKNPYSIYFKVEDEKINAYQLSIFGAPIPTITYHFKF